jgi:diguanylate cyclase (GGDEF)-like protein
MRLFNQALLSISLVALFMFGGAWIAYEAIVKPNLDEVEAIADRKDLRRVLQAIDGKQQQLVALAYDRVMSDTPADRLPVAESFIALNLNYFASLDRDGEPLSWMELDSLQGVFVPARLPFDELALYLSPTRMGGKTVSPVFSSGWMRTRHGPLLYAIASGNGSGVLIASDADHEFLRDISESVQLGVRIQPLPHSAATTAFTPLESVRRTANDEIHWTLVDPFGQPAAHLILQMPPRTIIARLAITPLVVAFIIAVLAAVFLLALVERSLIQPIRGLGQHLHRIRELGDYSLRAPQTARNELGELSRELNSLVEQVQTQQLQLIAQSREMQALSYQDGLTGLANRRRFDQALADNWAMAQRQRNPLALIMCDVDYFKPYNDNYGHQKGDEVLRQLARIIDSVVTRTSDLATRYGGEEFAILLPDTTEGGALHIARLLEQRLKDANIQHDFSHICRRLTVSIGVASMVPEQDHSPRDLVRLADEALYAAKAGGRNRIELATELM